MSLACDDVGQGKPLVLLHAFPLSRAMWRPQIEGLRGECRLILPDLPGFGDSPLPAGAGSAETMADAVAEVLDARGIREPVVLGGLSMGGYIAFAFVRKHAHRLSGLILADTRCDPDDETAKANRDKLIAFASSNPASAVVEQMLPRLLGARTTKENPAVVEEARRIGAAQKPAGIVAALHALRDRPDSTPTLSQVTVPTLVLVGEDDVLTPPALSKEMAARLACSTLVVVENAGHLTNLEQPAAFNAAVKTFLGCTKLG
jgi:pimeloyl-ACP methyl ester carboxylesterase